MLLFINLITLSRIILGAVIFVLLTRTEMYWYAFILFFLTIAIIITLEYGRN